MAEFKIIKGSIIDRKGDVQKTGTILTTGEHDKNVLNAAHIPELLRDGKIIEVGGVTVQPLPPVSSTLIIVDANGNVRAPELTSLWTLKADDIKDKSLDELNAMILERDPKATIQTDKIEAIAWLSQDAK